MKNLFGNVASFVLLAVAQCFLRWSPVAALAAKPLDISARRTCTDSELSRYAWMVAVGPAQPPRCTPAYGQLLQVPPAQGGAKERKAGLAAVSSHLQFRKPAKKGVHFVHLHVVQSDAQWCAPPCDGPSWELAAPKPKKSSPYVLLEAAIWRQFRNVTLYQFDEEWSKLAQNSYHGLCDGKAWGCDAYIKHRASKALLTIGPWPEELDWDAPGLSAYLKDAFEKVLSKLPQFAGKDNSNTGITYSGHGGDGDGALFAGVIDSADAVSMLKGFTDTRGKFSLFNFGTNCAESRWRMLAAMTPFADYILASDLNVGGLTSGDDGADIAYTQAKAKLADVTILKEAMEARKNMAAVVPEIIFKRRELWLNVQKDDMTKQKLRQSIAAFVSANFADFATSLKAAYQGLDVDKQEVVKSKAEASECDVLTVARYIDSSAVGGAAFVQSRKQNVTNAAGPLEKQFLAFRSEYASTQSLFAWQPVTNGLGFNFKDSSKARCDLETAFGKLGCGPVCEKKEKKEKAADDAYAIQQQKQEEKFQKEMKKVIKKQLEDEENHGMSGDGEEERYRDRHGPVGR